MKYLFSIYVFFFYASFSCLNISMKNHQVDMIKTVVLSEEFSKNFQICKKDYDEILVFNDSEDYLELTFSKKNHCLKTITFSEIDFEYNVNSIFSQHKCIVFKGILNGEGWVGYFFIDLESNLGVLLKYNNENDLIDTEVGQY